MRKGQVVETAEHPIAAVPPTPPGAATDLVLARYRLVRRLGSGGFGTVWLAHDERLDRAVAVKRIPVEGRTARERAEREALAAARLSHPGIVALYEAGQDDAAVYLVSELVRGRTLDRLLADGDLSDLDVVEVGISLCDALSHAHGRGVIHRDVKPANVIVPDVQPEGEATAKLTDFGIARVMGDDALTATGDVVGTLAYMAPEQAEGRPITEAADLYAAALVLYEALCGVNPVRGRGAAATARRVGARMPALARMRRDLPPGLCRAVDRAVSADPAQRGSLADLRAALVRARDDVGDVPGTVAPARADRLIERTARFTSPRVGRAPAGPIPHGDEQPWDVDHDEPGTAPLPAAGRMAAAGGAGALVAVALATLAPAPPLPAAAAALAAAVLVAVLPRLGWLLAAAGVVGWLAVAAPGVALIVSAGLAPVPLLLARRGLLWSAPAGAPLLGLIGLAPAWPALAGQCRRPWDRAALGALGLWWVLLTDALAGGHLLFGTAPAAWARARWEQDPAAAAEHVLVPLVSSGAPALAALWALAAAVLPLVVRGRRAAVDIVAAATWAGALAGGTAWILRAVDPAGRLDARGVAAGAVLGALVAVGARAARGAS